MSSSGNQPPKTAAEHFNSTAAQYERSTGGCTRELARDLLDLPDLENIYSPDSLVLDNACGTGIVVEEIIKRCTNDKIPIPTITAVDAAENMVGQARAKFQSSPPETAGKLSFQTMPGEKLDFPDDSFTHNVTNLGILFFTDGDAGAREIYRTLKSGGVAVVTSWAELGYLSRVIHPAQRLIRPCDPVFKLPIPELWLQPSYVEQCLKIGGFKNVRMQEMSVHYGASTAEDLAGLLVTSFQTLYKDWPEHEKKQFVKAVGDLVRKTSVGYTMPDGEEGVGIPMKAIVAVCLKE